MSAEDEARRRGEELRDAPAAVPLPPPAEYATASARFALALSRAADLMPPPPGTILH